MLRLQNYFTLAYKEAHFLSELFMCASTPSGVLSNHVSQQFTLSDSYPGKHVLKM